MHPVARKENLENEASQLFKGKNKFLLNNYYGIQIIDSVIYIPNLRSSNVPLLWLDQRVPITAIAYTQGNVYREGGESSHVALRHDCTGMDNRALSKLIFC
jgi:hypothetical protein